MGLTSGARANPEAVLAPAPEQKCDSAAQCAGARVLARPELPFKRVADWSGEFHALACEANEARPKRV